MAKMTENWLQLNPKRYRSHYTCEIVAEVTKHYSTSNPRLNLRMQSSNRCEYQYINFELDEVKRLVPQFVNCLDETAHRQVLLDMLGNFEEDELIQFLAYVVKQAKKNSQSRVNAARSNGSPRTSRQL